MTSDASHMALALALAARGRGTTSPNPMVGAVIVDDDGVVVGRGAHEYAGGPHAEVHALASAGDRAQGATLYCTLEPCSHTGRTGPCAPRVVEAGIRRAVVAMEDPNPLVSGRGLDYLRSHGVEVTVGVLEREAERLNGPFLTMMREHRPYVVMKAAISRDGSVASAPGARTPITGEAAARRIHRDRAEYDALAVGSETVLVDDPMLTPRGVFRRRPLVRVVFDRRLRTPPSARLFSTLDTGPVIIVTSPGDSGHAAAAGRLTEAGARVEIVDAPADRYVRAALERLCGSGVTSMIVEGGPVLHRAFWHAGVVDRVQMYVAPTELGPAAVRWIADPAAIASRLENVERTPLGADVLIEGDVHRTR